MTDECIWLSGKICDKIPYLNIKFNDMKDGILYRDAYCKFCLEAELIDTLKGIKFLMEMKV